MDDRNTVQDGVPGAVDLCQLPATFSMDRFVLFTLLFLAMFPGALVLCLLFADWPYGIQLASMIAYTSAIVLYTFSKNKSLQRYLFRCPFVRRALPRLALQHIGFLGMLFVIETQALRFRPRLPASWLVASGGRGSMPRFDTGLFILCICLALIQIISNRAILGRAHAEDAPDQNGGVLSSH
jgi:hypothetical protein